MCMEWLQVHGLFTLMIAQLTGSCEHHKRVSYHMLLAWEEIKIQNSKFGFS